MGNLFKDMKCLDQAIQCYLAAIRIRPSFADAWSNLAGAYKDGGHITEAIAAYRQAVALNPTSHDARANLIHSLVFVCDWATRSEDFARCVCACACFFSRKIDSSDGRCSNPPPSINTPPIHSLSAMLREQLGGEADDGAGRASDASTSSTSTAASSCSSLASTSTEGPALLDPAAFVLPSVQPFHALVYPLSLKEMLAIARRYAQKALLNVRALGLGPFYPYTGTAAAGAAAAAGGAPGCDGRIHIGYVSSDLGNHPLSHLMQSVFGLHDRRRFQVTCYALSPPDGSEWRARIERESETFRDISALGHGEAASRIHWDGVDILVNLNGYTGAGRNEIFALQPAPLQVGRPKWEVPTLICCSTPHSPYNPNNPTHHQHHRFRTWASAARWARTGPSTSSRTRPSFPRAAARTTRSASSTCPTPTS